MDLYTLLGVRKKQVASARFVWKLPPEDHGGLLAERGVGFGLGATPWTSDDPHAHVRRAAGDRGGRAGRYCFLVLLPRLAQVHVDVDQSRRDNRSARDFEHHGIRGRQ